MRFYTPLYKARYLDPRKGEDFTYKTFDDSYFSSLDNGLFVIDIQKDGGKFFSSEEPEAFDAGGFAVKAMMTLGGTGFVTRNKVTRKARASIKSGLHDLREFEGSNVGYFPLNGENIEFQVSLRKQKASKEEWGIGCCNGRFKEPGDSSFLGLFWDLGYLLAQPERIEFLSYYTGEWDRTTIFVKPFPGLEKMLAEAGGPPGAAG